MRIGVLSVAFAVLVGMAVGVETDILRGETSAATTQATRPGDGVKAGETVAVDLGDGVKLELVYIPAGKFLMGRAPTEADKARDAKKANGTIKGEWSPFTTEYPQHEVTISKAFYMGKYEVTNAQFEKVMGYIPRNDKDPKFPVSGGSVAKGSKEKVLTLTWEDTQTFCAKASKLTGKVFRLPSEAEWEYAARAGGPPCVFTEEQADEIAWWGSKGDGKIHAVGGKKPNEWGLYDMFGNVYEWTQDWAAPYTAEAVVDPHGPEEKPADITAGTEIKKSGKVVRGGGPYRWMALGSLSTGKFSKQGGKSFSRSDVGFRVVVEIPQVP